MSAPGRRSCPVLTCTNSMGEQIMCTQCWLALPSYVRNGVDTCIRAVRRQNTFRNRERSKTAIANAIRTANSVRAGAEVKS